jgi:extracellular factor (EF) 3-hydroxypalmitic acid methyl ester biosynthesis protein
MQHLLSERAQVLMTGFIGSPVVVEYPALVAPAPSATERDLATVLDRVLECDRPGPAVDLLRHGLAKARRACTHPDEWRSLVDRLVRTHPALSMAHEDPFTWRCYSKPRGYAGDAVMLDFIYRHEANRTWVERASLRGRALLAATSTTPASRAVRNRCRLLADEIDSLCARNADADVLSIACGHLREAGHSDAIRDGAFRRVVALDQDLESLAVVRSDYESMGVEAVEGSVKTVIARGRQLGQFDFVYAAGLYDYLNDKVGARLLQALFELVKPGGKVWIANFLPDIADVGLMEAAMDWWLIYRTPDEIRALTAALPSEQVAGVRTFTETENNVVFLEVQKH